MISKIVAGIALACIWWLVMALWVAPEQLAVRFLGAVAIVVMVGAGFNPFTKRPW